MERKRAALQLMVFFSLVKESRLTQKCLQERHAKQQITKAAGTLRTQDLKVLTVEMIWKEMVSLATPPKLALLARIIGLFSGKCQLMVTCSNYEFHRD